MTVDKGKQVFRVDRFVVPMQAGGEFVDKVLATHERLKTPPGFVEDFVLEQTSSTGESNIVTLVRWESAEAMEAAKPLVKAKHKELGFDPQELFARLNIEADLGTYKQVLEP